MFNFFRAILDRLKALFATTAAQELEVEFLTVLPAVEHWQADSILDPSLLANPTLPSNPSQQQPQLPLGKKKSK